MAETKHTPGPWGIAEPKHPDPRQIEDRLIFATVEGERLHVAEVYQYQNDKNREANGTALANARLIAAAPETARQRDELLKALKALLPWVAKAQADGAFLNCVVPDGGIAAIDQAEAAIAKAIGKD